MTDTFTFDADALDAERLRKLRGMKLLAVGLLVFAAIVFIATLLSDSTATWVGYVRAAAEAAMVGAFADWFAVTALFRHPLGIPIPHTALIPKGKDAIGRGLGEFVQRNFLAPDHLAERVREANVASRLGVWLAEPDNAAVVSGQLAGLASASFELVRDEDVQASIEELVARQARSVEVAPLLGKGVELLIADGYHETIVDAGIRSLRRIVADNEGWLRSRLYEESPWWVPSAVDDVVFAKAHDALTAFLAEVEGDAAHPLRRSLTERVGEFAERLRTDPDLIERAEALKGDLIEHPEFRAWSRSLWTSVKGDLLRGIEQPDSDLRKRIDGAIVRLGESLREDPTLAERVDAWVTSTVRNVVAESGDEAARLIATTVERWDAVETSRRLELQVGRDLQFIRINGTIVGALIGLIIHAVSELL